MTMKSIMEEASSITKAIEKAWQRAGKPAEFKVKIFEEPICNFFGICTKPAKIGLFFTDGQQSPEPKEKAISKQPEKKVTKPEVSPKTAIQSKQKEQLTKQQPKQQKVILWQPTMTQAISGLINEMLGIINSPSVATFTVNNNYLNISFSQPITNTPQKERQFYRSLAYLIMTSMRNKFKFELRNLKLVITNEKQNNSE